MEKQPENPDKLNKLIDILNRCDRCGACTLVCPLYKVRPLDRSTARGKIALTRAVVDGLIDDGDEALRDALDFCLLCGACTDVCPSKVLTADAMMDMREQLGARHGIRLHHRLIGNAMASNGFKAIGRRGIALAQRLNIPRYSGGLLPANERYFTARQGAGGYLTLPRHDSRDTSTIKTVAYFQGCAMRLFFPEAADATRRLLAATGRQMSEPTASCCGVPQLAHGQSDLALALAKENIRHFADVDAIVTDCGSCGATLKEYALRLAGDPDWHQRAADFSRRIWSLSEFLDACGYEPKRHTDLRITYHDSCHLNRSLKVHDAPRRLLAKAGNYVEMDLAEMCCGGAGSFQLDYPDVSNDILNLKYESACRAEADLLVCECPSCLMQLGKLAQRGNLKVLHLSQVL